MTREYAFYPGCSSQLKASASNYLTSVESMCRTLDVKLTPIPDWNCCGASISYAGSGEIARHAMNARNFALAEKHLPGRDMVATCAACWLNARETQEQLAEDHVLMRETRAALKEAGLDYSGKTPVKHMVEVLIEDFGYEALARPVVKPLEGLKFAGYVGCQTNRPFGIAGETLRPVLHMAATIGAEVPLWEPRTNFGDTDMLVLDMAQGRDLAQTVGRGAGALMRGHGSVAAGCSLREAVYIAIYLEINAHLQMDALRFGKKINFLSPGEIEKILARQSKGKPSEGFDRAWEGWCNRAGIPFKRLS